MEAEGVEMEASNTRKNFSWLKQILPYPEESLASFLGRWAQSNVLPSRTGLLQSLALPCNIRISIEDLQRLAVMLKVDVSVLEAIAPSTNPKIAALRRAHTHPISEAFCPQCLSEASYSRQLWSNCFATACPHHGKRLLDHCCQCRGDIRQDRPLAHICDCGADLRLQISSDAKPVEIAHASLLTGVMPKNVCLPFDLKFGIPPDIDLYLFGLANQFTRDTAGIAAAKNGKAPLPKNVEQAVAQLSAAFDLFSNWPENFDLKLKELIESADHTSTGAAARFGRWYFFLFRKYKNPAYEPLRVATANRIVTSHVGLINARTHCIQEIATVKKSWLTAREAGLALGVSTAKINAGIDSKLITANVHDASMGYRQRFISSEEIERLKRLQTENMSDASVVELLKVPEGIFSIMSKANWFTRSDPSSVPPIVSGYIQRTPLLELIERLRLAAIAASQHRSGDFVRFKDLNFKLARNREKLVDLFRSFATLEIQPVGADSRFSVGGLQYSNEQLSKRISNRFYSITLSLKQVSFLTGAKYDAVKGWINMGLLPAAKDRFDGRAPWVIELQALLTFLQTYAPLAFHAKACQTSSRGLSTSLAHLGVRTVEPQEGIGTLLKISDLLTTIKVSPAKAS